MQCASMTQPGRQSVPASLHRRLLVHAVGVGSAQLPRPLHDAARTSSFTPWQRLVPHGVPVVEFGVVQVPLEHPYDTQELPPWQVAAEPAGQVPFEQNWSGTRPEPAQ